MNYYPFHVGDYMTHTAHLSPLEDLAYRRLLDLYYISETCLPPDAAACARKIRMRDSLAEVQQVLSEFFTETPEGWRSQRCDEEIQAMRIKQEKARASAAASVAARAKKRTEPAKDEPPLSEGSATFEEPLNERSTNVERTLNERSTTVELPTPTPTPMCTSNDVLNPPTPLEGDAPRKAQRRVWNPKAIELPASICPQAWGQWIDYRRSRGLTVNEKTVKAQITKLDEWAALGQAPAAVIERSITNGWQGLFELPAPNNATRSMSNGTNGQLSERLRVAGEIFGPAATPAAGGDFIEGASIRLNG